MHRLALAAVLLTLGVSPAVGDSHVRFVVHGAAQALTTGATHSETPRSTQPIELRIAPPIHRLSLHPRTQPAQPKLHRYEAPPAPPAARIDFLSQSHTDDEPAAMNSLSTALYNTLPSTSTGSMQLLTPQMIKSADGRLLGAGLTARF